MTTGQNIVDLAMQHVGERYILGTRVPMTNANWRGPWDCAEFISWCTYHTYGLTFAVRPNLQTGESYSGWWYEDAIAANADTTVAKAIATPGAILVRKPGAFGVKIGHVAISRGDGTTVEAHSSAVGVAVRQNAAGRQWSIGVRLPGVSYSATLGTTPYSEPAGLLQAKKPWTKGKHVEAVQRALGAAGIDPGEIDGQYGPTSQAAVAAVQAREGLAVDGVVGPDTALALGLSWPLPG